MGGDLNLKKSWHPVLMSNQKKVWEEEKKALEERKRTEQRIKELKEERAKEEIQQKLEAAGSRKRVDRVDWMYQGPSSGQVGTTEEMEGYLLGKRRIDGLIKGTEHKKLEKQAAEDSFMALQHANTLRDTASKVREDPMLAIKRQEQAAYEAMMNDPIKRRALLAAIGGEAEKSTERSKDKKHRHHHRRHRDGSEEEQRRKRRTNDYRREDRSNRSYHSRRLSDSVTPDPKSVSPRRDHRHGSRRDQRSISPLRKDGGYERNSHRERDEPRRRRSPSYSSRSRSPSPNRRRKSYPADREQRDFVKQDRSSRNNGRNGYQRQDRYSGSGNVFGRNEGNGQGQSSDDKEAERQRKLEAMQQDASALDQDREKRLAALAVQENAEREADDLSRARSSKYGDKADFVNGMHRKAGDMGLADRIGRGRQGLQRDD